MGFIFETEIEQILNTVHAQTIGEDESITLRGIQVSPIHPALKAYFRAEVEKTLESERSKEMRSNRFPYAHPEILSLQHQIDLLLVQHYEFTQDEFERVLDEAVHFQFNYLCRPQFTLLGYIAGDRRRIPVAEVMRKLVRCVEYEYFPELIRRYCEDHGLAELSYEEFKRLLGRIDTEIVSRHTASELAAMTRGLISFVDFGRASPHDDQNQPTLPTNAAIVFYEDKGLDEIKLRLERARDEEQRDHLTLGELKDLLSEVWSYSITPGSEPDMPSLSEIAAASPAEQSPVESGSKLPPEPIQTPIVPISHDPAPPMAAPAGSSLANLHDRFSRKEVKRFVKTVFRKDDTAFRDALDKLNEIVVWDEASHLLDQIFQAQGIDPFSKEGVEFTDKVYSRFFPT